MGKYIKTFDNIAQYESYKNSNEYIAPNISMVKDVGVYMSGTPLTNFQTKDVWVIENGKSIIEPDPGFNYLRSVNLHVDTASSKSAYTGHADSEGLKAIGWTDEDIAYYQEHGVDWMEEDDREHKVTDDNKALYGVLTVDNISEYKDEIIYLPKIDTSNIVDMEYLFDGCYSLVSLPKLDTSKATDMRYMFNDCYSLTAVPKIDTAKCTNMSYMFRNCYSLNTIPQIDTSKVTNMGYMFYECSVLKKIPQLNTSNVTNMGNMFYGCCTLTTITPLNASNVTNTNYMFYDCCALKTINIQNIKTSLSFNNTPLLNKESLLYLINNEDSDSAITITLKAYTYDKLSGDADVVSALNSHPNISLTRTS